MHEVFNFVSPVHRKSLSAQNKRGAHFRQQFDFEKLLEKNIKRVHVLVGERPGFVATPQHHQAVKYDNCTWIESTSCHRGGQNSSLYSQSIFIMRLQKKVPFRALCNKIRSHFQPYSCHPTVETVTEHTNMTKK